MFARLVFLNFQQFSTYFDKKLENWRHVVSRNITWLDFPETLRKCFLPFYFTSVQIWNNFNVFRLLWKNVGILYLPFTKSPSLVYKQTSLKFQEICKNITETISKISQNYPKKLLYNHFISFLRLWWGYNFIPSMHK